MKVEKVLLRIQFIACLRSSKLIKMLVFDSYDRIFAYDGNELLQFSLIQLSSSCVRRLLRFFLCLREAFDWLRKKCVNLDSSQQIQQTLSSDLLIKTLKR